MDFEHFRQKLIVAGVDVACEKMGYSFDELFLDFCRGGNIPYADYYWCVYTTTDVRVKPNIYIHAIPQPDSPEDMPWEEWFVMDGTFHHHVCYPRKMPKTEHIVHISPDDNDHPLYTMDKIWHWYIESDLTPILYR